MNRIFRSFRLVCALSLSLGAAGAVAAQTLQVSPTAVTLSAQAGTTAAVSAQIALASSGDASGSHLNYSVFIPAGNGAWLSTSPVGPFNGVTPGNLTIIANPTGLQSGVYNGQVEVFANGPNNTQIIDISFVVGQLLATPSSLSFTYVTGEAVPQPLTVAVSGPGTPVGFTAAATVASGPVWLEVAPTSATTPATITVGLNPAVAGALGQGTYSGTITLTPTSGSNTPLTLPVNLTVSATPQIEVSPASLAFPYQIGGTNNITHQNLSVTTKSGAANFTASAKVDPNPAGATWLLVGPNSGTTPANLIVTIAPGALPAGSYAGQITISEPGASPAIVNVTLTVSANPLLGLSPNSLNFNYQVGTAVPAAQNITPTSTGAPLSYTATAATASGGNWLTAAGGGSTPNPTVVSINPAGLAPGTYSGTISFAAAAAGNSPQQIPVNLTVSNNPLIQAAPAAFAFVYQTGKTPPGAQNLAITSSTGAPLNYSLAATTASGGNWLSVTPAMGSTIGTVAVTVATTGLAPGTYTGSISITATNPTGQPVANSPLSIPVTYYVSDKALLEVNPYALTFTATTGGTASVQGVSLTSTSDNLNYTITSLTNSGGPWLAVSSQPGMTPGSFLVSAAALSLSPGTYTGSITVTATNPNGDAVTDSPWVIPVTFQVVGGTLGVAPTTLAFSQSEGGAAPATQTISVTGTGASPLSFTAAVSVNSGVNWLTVSPAAGNTPATLTVSVDGSKLSPGTYIGLITITSPGAAGSPQTVQVTLTVTATPTISVTPGTLNFSYQLGGSAPASQTVQVAATQGSLAFSASASTSGNSGNWLSLTPISGSTPASLSVAVNPTGLAAGTYNGTVTVTSAGASNSPQTVAVTLVVTPATLPVPTTVVNAASGIPGALAPGEIISIYGTYLGPAKGVGLIVSGGKVQTTLAGIQVLFDGLAAPLLYVSSGQINAVVPFELNGRFQTRMQVSNNGTVSSTLDLAVTPAAPGLFTLTQNGMGQGAILNSTGNVNGTNSPAAKGSIIVLYATGGGETTPIGVTGAVTPIDGTGLKQISGVTVMVGGQAATVLYAGSAPGFVEGALQINVQLPANVLTGQLPVLMMVNGGSSQPGVTVAVQ